MLCDMNGSTIFSDDDSMPTMKPGTNGNGMADTPFKPHLFQAARSENAHFPSSIGLDDDSMPTAIPGRDMAGILGRIDQYDLIRKLGGGFGVVYLARDTVSGVDVALKTLHPLLKTNAEEMNALREKFRLVHGLTHSNIAKALSLHQVQHADVWDDTARRELRLSPGDSVMVMDYAPGVTLSKWRRQFPDGRVPQPLAFEIARQIASALDYAHGEKIVHRDVKPGNIMVESLDKTIRVRLLDFGLAAEIRSSMSRVSTEMGDTSGTRPYMAPEQWLGKKQDGRTDQYALACVLYEMLSGEPPFAGVFETGDPAVMMAVVTGNNVPSVADLPKSVNLSLGKALAKAPTERYPSCELFIKTVKGSVKLPWSAPMRIPDILCGKGEKFRAGMEILQRRVVSIKAIIWKARVRVSSSIETVRLRFWRCFTFATVTSFILVIATAAMVSLLAWYALRTGHMQWASRLNESPSQYVALDAIVSPQNPWALFTIPGFPYASLRETITPVRARRRIEMNDTPDLPGAPYDFDEAERSVQYANYRAALNLDLDDAATPDWAVDAAYEVFSPNKAGAVPVTPEHKRDALRRYQAFARSGSPLDLMFQSEREMEVAKAKGDWKSAKDKGADAAVLLIDSNDADNDFLIRNVNYWASRLAGVGPETAREAIVPQRIESFDRHVAESDREIFLAATIPRLDPITKDVFENFRDNNWRFQDSDAPKLSSLPQEQRELFFALAQFSRPCASSTNWGVGAISAALKTFYDRAWRVAIERPGFLRKAAVFVIGERLFRRQGENSFAVIQSHRSFVETRQIRRELLAPKLAKFSPFTLLAIDLFGLLGYIFPLWGVLFVARFRALGRKIRTIPGSEGCE